MFIALGVRLWRAFLRAGDSAAGTRIARIALASSGVLATMLAVFSLLTVMANVQGAAAPFASLLPMLTAGADDARLTATLDEARRQLAASGPDASPALDVMLGDFTRYHVAMAVIAAIVAVAFAVLCAVLWKGFAAARPPRGRLGRVLGSFGVLSAVLSLIMIVVAAANTATAADPAPALLAFFEGGW
ncbi:hypothetical protein [Spirillospora sp. NPDC047279]|uniref:hypothetical protein n=1 Tax=Spirillospora sp. NPDC047279 TaxID=3155478 RepID=UPI0033E9807F